jgi:hypothetical protein
MPQDCPYLINPTQNYNIYILHMLYMHKTKFKIINNKVKKDYNIVLRQTNKGYNITGVDNGKIIKKSVRYKALKKRKTKKYKK